MNKKQKGFLLVILFSIQWSISILIYKLGLKKGLDPIALSVQIFLIAALLIFLYTSFFKAKYYKTINRKNIYWILLAGTAGAGLGGILSFIGLNLSTSINYGFIIKTSTIFSILFAFIFLKEKLSWYKGVLSAVLLVGAYLISTGGVRLVPHIGDILIIASGICFSIANVIMRFLRKRAHPDVLTAFRLLFASLFALGFALIIGSDIFNFEYPILTILGGISTGIQMILITRALQVTTVSYVTMMTMLTPVLVAFLGIIMLGEILNIYHVLGGIIIIISGILISKTDIHSD